jgi:pantothenate kinase
LKTPIGVARHIRRDLGGKDREGASAPAEERKAEEEEGAVWAPGFDHAAKDPVERAVRVGPEQRVVVLEGNYVLLQPPSSSTDSPAWAQAAALLDERWFVSVDEEAAGARLVARHVAAGITAGEDEAWARVRGNDLPNGRVIVRGRGDVDEEVVSREDGSWKANG